MIPSPKFNKDIAFSGALNAEPPNDLTFSISSDALSPCVRIVVASVFHSIRQGAEVRHE